MAFNGRFVIQLEELPEDVAPSADVLELLFEDCPDGNLQPGTLVYFDEVNGLELELIVSGPLIFKDGWEVMCQVNDLEALTNFVRHIITDCVYVQTKKRLSSVVRDGRSGCNPWYTLS